MSSTHSTEILITALLLTLTTPCLSNDEGTWNKKLLYKSAANLSCKETLTGNFIQQEVDFYWLLPSGQVVGTSALPGNDRYSLLNNGSILFIKNIMKEDFGVYICLVIDHSNHSVLKTIKLGINVDGPYFGDMWQKYKSNLQNGLLASAVTFVIMGMFCYNHNQFQSSNDNPNDFNLNKDVELLVHTHREENNKPILNSAFEHDIPEVKEEKETISSEKLEPETKF